MVLVVCVSMVLMCEMLWIVICLLCRCGSMKCVMSVVVVRLMIEYSLSCMRFGKLENSIDVNLYIDVSMLSWIVG